MSKAKLFGGLLGVGLVLAVLALAARHRSSAPVEARGGDRPGGARADAGPPLEGTPAPASAPAASAAASSVAPASSRGFLYGRITANDGTTYLGRLRWGLHEEAFWGDFFNGAKKENAWAALVEPARLPKERHAFKVFGLEFAPRERPVDLGRLFMARFGGIARLDADGRTVRVTLKSGTTVVLDRFSASDFDDDVRVWDAARGVVDLDSRSIRSIELLPATAQAGPAEERLHGTVRTARGEFSGFLQWNREGCVGSDGLVGETAGGRIELRFDTIRSIARRSAHGSLVTERDGREIELSGTPAAGDGNRGVYVDDARYGRVLVSWDAFERVDFTPGDSGPAYGDFPPGRALTGGVTTRDGRRLAGRLVYDLDESETTETLDAPAGGVDYTIPLALVASIVPAAGDARSAERARVTLSSGEVLALERAGDLGDGNAGILVFGQDAAHPDYLPWADVERVDFAVAEAPPR